MKIQYNLHCYGKNALNVRISVPIDSSNVKQFLLSDKPKQKHIFVRPFLSRTQIKFRVSNTFFFIFSWKNIQQ